MYRFRKLPKSLRKLPVYDELQKIITDFNGICPLLELIGNKAVKERHWNMISELCNVKLNIESESFNLSTVMKAELFKFKDEIEVSKIEVNVRDFGYI